MAETKVSNFRSLRRFVADTATGGVVYALIAGLMGSALSAAPLDLSTLASHSHRILIITIVGFVFATLFALNLSFFRHLRRAYARPIRQHANIGSDPGSRDLR
jgi:membrane protein DedA with SNARE-associated domain